jgi:hypothetical protein
MPPLPRELRQVLDRTVVEARAAAESAARAALSTLAVDRDKAFDQLSEPDRELRRALRAKERQLGSYDALVSEIAYQHWHRMLFARFLAENDLLIHPDAGVAVPLSEVADLAREEGEPDPWVLAARYAARMLPAIFREGDPELALRFAPEGRKSLEDLLASLPASVFTSDDALGWVYQFWQSEKKKEVNKSGNKIGAAELPAVTQLFTEDYMVRFLLENSLGAWWAGHHPDSPLLERFTFLRFSEGGTPAAGTFEGWPETVAEITLMDPCCGSGHFLTVAFEMLTAMRTEEEGLSAREAGDAVIEQNLFGLEIDPRCTQIAAFALALSAWRSGGYRELPAPNIACSGIGVAGQLSDWKKLAGTDPSLENALAALHEQFRKAPEFGSLVDPRRATEEGHLFSVDYEKVAPLLEGLLSREEDPETRVAGWAAAGISRAASFLARTYEIVVTNPPFLGRGKQDDSLRRFLEGSYPDARQDLATAFLVRVTSLCANRGTMCMVTPQNWFVQATYRDLRVEFLKSQTLSFAAVLGEEGFEAFGIRGPRTVLLGIVNGGPPTSWETWVLDVSTAPGNAQVLIPEKLQGLGAGELKWIRQEPHLSNPSARILFSDVGSESFLRDFAKSYQGLKTGDDARFRQAFWESAKHGPDWRLAQGVPVHRRAKAFTTWCCGGAPERISLGRRGLGLGAPWAKQ